MGGHKPSPLTEKLNAGTKAAAGNATRNNELPTARFIAALHERATHWRLSGFDWGAVKGESLRLLNVATSHYANAAHFSFMNWSPLV